MLQNLKKSLQHLIIRGYETGFMLSVTYSGYVILVISFGLNRFSFYGLCLDPLCSKQLLTL